MKTLLSVDALRQTSNRLENGADYNWCHMGQCNCGHLAQTLTKLSPAEIHEMAIQRAGDWTDQSIEYCTATGYTVDHVFETITKCGFTKDDIRHLERLSDQRVLKFINPTMRRNLDHKNVEHVVLYMRTWADLIENTLVSEISLDKLIKAEQDLV